MGTECWIWNIKETFISVFGEEKGNSEVLCMDSASKVIFLGVSLGSDESFFEKSCLNVFKGLLLFELSCVCSEFGLLFNIFFEFLLKLVFGGKKIFYLFKGFQHSVLNDFFSLL